MNWLEKRIINWADKRNPAQSAINTGTESSTTPVIRFYQAYDKLEVVNRSVNMVVDDVAGIPFLVRNEQILTYDRIASGVKHKSLHKALNYYPNPYQDISSFKRDIVTDYILDGNIFIYFDGSHFYHLPSSRVTIHPSDKTRIAYYEFEDGTKFNETEVIHIKENSFRSNFRGTSRLLPAEATMQLMLSMRGFQDNFFKNGAVPGLIITSPNTLSEKIKDRLLSAWQAKYSPNSGGRRPLILDGGLGIDKISSANFQELDFENSLLEKEKVIYKAMGIPPVLMEGGNNANIRPNLRLYYVETVIPIFDKIGKALEKYFGFAIEPDLTKVLAMQPDLRDASQFYTSLVNAGILTPNEARNALGFEDVKDGDEIRIPANIAGSATNPDEGGRPVEETDEND